MTMQAIIKILAEIANMPPEARKWALQDILEHAREVRNDKNEELKSYGFKKKNGRWKRI